MFRNWPTHKKEISPQKLSHLVDIVSYLLYKRDWRRDYMLRQSLISHPALGICHPYVQYYVVLKIPYQITKTYTVGGRSNLKVLSTMFLKVSLKL